jgi:DNA repair protein RecN (Recombination protein N)
VLRELHLTNLAVLAGAGVEFGPGFNVLTGETGAGKSIVLDALALLGGARASADLIRSGAPALAVTGVFAPPGAAWRQPLRAAGLDAFEAGAAAGELLVRREIQRDGRNRVFVNDQPATLKLLAELQPHLLRIHGQRDEQELVSAQLQRAWLDRSGGAASQRLLDRVGETWRRHGELAARLANQAAEERLRGERSDLLRFQLSEIDAARLVAGEDESLVAERGVLRNVEAISAALGEAVELLADAEGAVGDRLAQARTRLGGIADWEPQASAWSGEAEELRIRAQELAGALRHRLDAVEADPKRLDAVEDRLAAIERLTKKHGDSAARVLHRAAELRLELERLEAEALDAGELEAAASAALAAYREAALELSRARAAAAPPLAERVIAELADLALPKARFTVRLERRPRADSPLRLPEGPVECGPHGIDAVEFLFSPNPGEEPRPLARVASGGELSRVYLALQLAAGVAEGRGETGVPALVFDEIDAGMGGAEGFVLGRKLRRLARAGQVLAVTHLAQVASQADHHFKVRKRVEGERTFATVESLEGEERIAEIARMVSGKSVTTSSLSHARQLLESAAADAPAKDRSGSRRR